jgi:hypothetical protein
MRDGGVCARLGGDPVATCRASAHLHGVVKKHRPRFPRFVWHARRDARRFPRDATRDAGLFLSLLTTHHLSPQQSFRSHQAKLSSKVSTGIKSQRTAAKVRHVCQGGVGTGVLDTAWRDPRGARSGAPALDRSEDIFAKNDVRGENHQRKKSGKIQ